MRKEMKIISLLAACLMLVGCGNKTESPVPPTPEGMTRVPDGKFVFSMPSGWVSMPQEEYYTSRGFSAAFQKGEDSSPQSSYFLVQVKQQKKWSAKALQSLADKAAPLTSVQDLKDYISSEKHKAKPELYDSTHDVFVMIQEYPDPDGKRQPISVMVKRFLEKHYVVLHFYLRDSLEADVGVIADVLDSIKFDEDGENRTKP